MENSSPWAPPGPANFGSALRKAPLRRLGPSATVQSMIHYVFACQMAALLMGTALLPLLIARMKSCHGSFPAAFLAADLAMLARTLVFSVVHYDQSTRLGIFPAHFEESSVAGFIYLLFVAAAAWLILAGLFRATRIRGLLVLSLPYWAYICLVSSVYLVVMFDLGIPRLLWPLVSYGNMAIVPFVAIKAYVAAACILVMVLALVRERSLRLAAAAALAALAQAGDAWLRLDESSYALSVPLLYLPFFGALFMVAFPGRRGLAGLAGDARVEPGLAASWSREAGLEAEETRLLDLLLEGKANKEIAFSLGLGLSAEKHRVQKLFRKLGVSTRSELLSRAAERAILSR